MSKQKTATSGAKVRKTFVNVLIHIFLAILAFIWVLPVFWGSTYKLPCGERFLC